MLVVLVFLAGLFTIITMQREELPTISLEMIKITTSCPGASPEDVEINVTNKIEKELLEVENVKKITSMSMENSSIILAEIDPDIKNPQKTKTDIRDAVLRVTDLPSTVTEQPLIEELTNTYPMCEVALYGDVSELRLRTLARDLENSLREIRGVSSIQKIGYRKREIAVEPHLTKMMELSISFNEIIDSIKSRNVRSTGGAIESYTSEKKVITLSEYDHPMEVKNVIVRSNFEGRGIRLSDIAMISDTFEEPRVLYRGNGKPAIAVLVSKQEGADIINLSDDIKKTLASFRKTLPSGVSADEIYDSSLLTRTMLDIVVNNAVVGFILVVLVMLYFLDRKSALWSAFGIPFSILASMTVFPLFDVNLNTVSLATMILVIGMIVDDATVITEKIHGLKQEGMGLTEASVTGVKTMLLPVAASSFTTIIAFLPVLLIPGIMGRFVRQIPIVITIILGISLIEAFFFLPAHVHRTRPAGVKTRSTRQVEKAVGVYYGLVLRLLSHRKKVTAAFIIFLVFIFSVSAVFMRFMLEEDIDPDYFSVIIEAPRGTPLLRTGTMVADIETSIYDTVPRKAMRGLSTQVGHHNRGRSLGAVEGQYSNFAIITVYLAPASERDISSETIMASLRTRLDRIRKEKKFVRLDVELETQSAGKAVECTYICDDDTLRTRLEKETIDFLGGIRGITGIESSNVPGKEELRIRLDHRMLVRAGLTALDVSRTVRTAFDGTVVTSIRMNGEDIDYRVRLHDPRRYRAEGILDLPVSNREGKLVALRHFARLEERPGAAVHHHHGGRRSVTISANVDSKLITASEVNRRLTDRFADKAGAMPGMTMKLGGQDEETGISMRGFFFALIVAVAAIYFILVVLFNSYLQPALILSIIPFAVGGVFLTLMAHGRPLVYISLIGLLGLTGVVVNNVIVLIDHLNRKCDDKGDTCEIVARGSSDRFRAVAITTLTTFAGLIPTAYGIGGDLPLIRPLVLVMAWGLLFSSVVTLGFIPVLYSFARKVKPGPVIN